MSNKVKFVLIPVALFCLSFGVRLSSLLQTEFANGWDAYFYLVQVKSMVEEEAMHSPDNALVYPFIHLVYLLSGDYILAFKVVTSILAGLFTVLVFGVGRQWNAPFGICLLLASWMVFSPHLTYFAAQYPKNLFGMILFLALLATWKLPLSLKGIAVLAINFFGHKLTFGLSLIYIFLHLVFTRMRLSRLVVGFGLVVALIGCVVLYKSDDVLSVFSGRFSGMISAEPQLPFFSFLNEFEGLLSVGWRFEIWAMLVLFILAAIMVVTTRFLVADFKPRIWAIMVLLGFLVFPFWSWSLTGFAYRFFLVLILIVPLLVTLFTFLSEKAAYICSLALIFLSLFSWRAYNPVIHDPPYAEYHRISVNAASELENYPVELVIAHNSLAEYFTFTTGIDGMPWRPDYSIGKDSLWRLATGINEQMLRHYLPKGEISLAKKVTYRYFLVREDVWQIFLTAVKNDDVELYEDLNNWKNPFRIRPGFLKNKTRNHK